MNRDLFSSSKKKKRLFKPNREMMMMWNGQETNTSKQNKTKQNLGWSTSCLSHTVHNDSIDPIREKKEL